ncbi:MAG TPA: DUF1501 domain-containing protein [Blastocatellia bacterium]|nr:DUF1501 domain-containing protein [Blastocatellia bacterium]
MTITRRQFIKTGLGTMAIGLVMPKSLLGQPASASSLMAGTSGPGRNILVIVQLAGGNDGLNTVIPYTDSNYSQLRPTIGFLESELVDANGNSTIISDQFGLHPALSEIKALYDQKKAAIVLGVGYPNPNLSHFLSMDIWETADLTGSSGEGWLGKYADISLSGATGLPAAAVGGLLPKAMFSPTVVIPSIIDFNVYNFTTDPAYSGDSTNQLGTFQQNGNRSLSAGSLVSQINNIGMNAVNGALLVQSSISKYSSSVVYPNDNPLAQGFQMLAELLTTIDELQVVYVTMGSFDHHADEVANTGGTPDRKSGQHAQLLAWFSQAVNLFYQDLTAHSLADNTLIMTWSEFGRRVQENTSFGTDHGTASPLFVIGNPVKGGQLYGSQPSLANLDEFGNMQFTEDFRSVYSTILDKWLAVDSTAVLGADPFTRDLGFLG